MIEIELIGSFVIAYLLGSIPTAVWVSKIFYGFDIRERGSGNAGATNVFRVLGKKSGIIVLTVDILKGIAAVVTASFFAAKFYPEYESLIEIIAGFFAILGHIFPVFAKFRGGKGVATTLGTVIGINILASVVAIIVFLIVFLLKRYVSLGSIFGAISFIITVLIFTGVDDLIMLIYGVILVTVVILSHLSNIKRLLNGTENKIYFKKKLDKR